MNVVLIAKTVCVYSRLIYSTVFRKQIGLQRTIQLRMIRLFAKLSGEMENTYNF